MTHEPYQHPACLDDEALADQCQFRRQRRSGPGGQHRNKVETAIFVRHAPTGVEAEATERRSQADNRKLAISRLRHNLAIEVRSPLPLSADVPSALWRSRCRNGRLTISDQHRDFASILAEGIDVMNGCEFDLDKATSHLGCTKSQLIKLFRKEPRALQLVNSRRSAMGLRALK